MKISTLACSATLALCLTACASTPADPVIPAPSGPATQERWDAGQIAHLEWNGARRGWTTTESGLQYRLIGKANPKGAQPVETDTVMVHYRGKLITGTEFDSSYSRNEPTSFPLNQVIKGWTEGVALMREGETYEFLIPAELAYGQRRVGNIIPSNSALNFTVELLKVNP